MKCTSCPNPDFICSCILHPRYKKIKALKIIVREVAKAHDKKISDLKSKSRTQDIVRIRNIAIQRCRYETKASLNDIGYFFNRSHSTILHSLKQATQGCSGECKRNYELETR